MSIYSFDALILDFITLNIVSTGANVEVYGGKYSTSNPNYFNLVFISKDQ